MGYTPQNGIELAGGAGGKALSGALPSPKNRVLPLVLCRIAQLPGVPQEAHEPEAFARKGNAISRFSVLASMAAAKPFIPTLTDGVFRRIWSRQRPAQHADSDLCRRSPGSLSKSTPEDRRDGNQAWKRRPVNLLQGLCDNRRQVPLATGTLELHKRQNSPKNSTLAGACTVVACTLWPELEPCLCERGVSLPARLLPSRSQ